MALGDVCVCTSWGQAGAGWGSWGALLAPGSVRSGERGVSHSTALSSVLSAQHPAPLPQKWNTEEPAVLQRSSGWHLWWYCGERNILLERSNHSHPPGSGFLAFWEPESPSLCCSPCAALPWEAAGCWSTLSPALQWLTGTAHASATHSVSLAGFATPTGENICSNSERTRLHPVILSFLFPCLRLLFQFCFCSRPLLKELLWQTLDSKQCCSQDHSSNLSCACIFSTPDRFWKPV